MSSSAPLILPFANIQPDIAGPLLHAGPGSAVLGRVTLGRNAWLGALSVIRADGHFVTVGDDFHLGRPLDRCTSTTRSTPASSATGWRWGATPACTPAWSAATSSSATAW